MDTKHEQIVAYMIREVEGGHIRSGHKLPSVRAVAKMFSCSPNTVVRAYQTLERDDVIYPVAKSGYYLVEGKNRTSARTESERIDFASTTPRGDFLPFQEMEHCLRKAISVYKEELFGYTDPQGIFSLRNELSRYFYGQQIFAKPDHIAVVTGAQQAFSILTRMPFPGKGQAVLVEQPTYFGFLAAARVAGCPVIGIQRDEQGIDLEVLESHFRSGQFKFFYTVPRFLNPLGTSYSLEQKTRIAELARQYDVYIVEDDYLADLEEDAKADPLYGLDLSSHVIYVKSFSKTILPGIRMGAVILPEPMLDLFITYKNAADVSSPILSQGALEIYIKSGMYRRHAARIRAHYREKMRYATEVCAHVFGSGISYTCPSSGVFITLRLPKYVKASVLQERLKQRGVSVTNVDLHLLPENQRNDRIRLCIIGVEKPRIEAGLTVIEQEIRRLELRMR
ncbi:PLP-dependent aminotransferase family protein [Paenibacillus lautus]|uniref:aminotransferase-like domain-containing protein n=1 Tax=Paenibacillus lautus TaxID=1401 RepID=UPI003D264E34